MSVSCITETKPKLVFTVVCVATKPSSNVKYFVCLLTSFPLFFDASDKPKISWKLNEQKNKSNFRGSDLSHSTQERNVTLECLEFSHYDNKSGEKFVLKEIA